MLNELAGTPRVVGVKQVRRALAGNQAKRVYLARDADSLLTLPLERQALDQGVEAVWVGSMKALGRACGIAVGAAVAAVL